MAEPQIFRHYGTNTIVAATCGFFLATLTMLDILAYPVGFAILPRCAGERLFDLAFAMLCAINFVLFLLSCLLMFFSDTVSRSLAASPRPTAAAEGSLMSATYAMSKMAFFLTAAFLITLFASEPHLRSIRLVGGIDL